MHENESNDGGRILNRRDWLIGGVSGLGLSLLANGGAVRAGDVRATANPRAAGASEQELSIRRDMIREFVYPRGDLDAWLAGKAFPFCKYDGELGYLHIDRQFKEGLDGAVCTYRYDANGARHTSACADRPCRINSYGNSFTSCEQVSDHETWQEVLAAHLGEPIRNFGIGGYSVYQAYLRMRREEQRVPARYVIFNIYDDDHYRNLYGWQRGRFGINRKSTHPPIPHVRADADAGTFVERPNPCPTPESLYQLCDFDRAYAIFGDDQGISRVAARRALRAKHPANVPRNDNEDVDFTRQALYATTRILELVERFAASENRQVLYVLSYSPDRVRQFLKERRRFDSSLVEFLQRRNLPYVDLLEAHRADFEKFSVGIDAYVARYFIGHYAPLGNFFCAFAIKDALARRLNPPAPAYTASTANDPR